MGIYISLFETVNGCSRPIKTGKYGIEGCELIFNETNHVGGGLFSVSGKEAITNCRKVLNEISEKANEFSDKRFLDMLVSRLSSLNLSENAVYSVDFSEYFSSEQENKEFDPACIITERKRHLENGLYGYCEFGKYKQAIDDDYVEMLKEIPEIRSVFCSSHDKDNLVFSVDINYTEEDKKEFRQTSQFLDDYFVASHNKRRLFFSLKQGGLNEFSLLDKGTESFYVVVSRDELQNWLDKREQKTLDNSDMVREKSKAPSLESQINKATQSNNSAAEKQPLNNKFER